MYVHFVVKLAFYCTNRLNWNYSAEIFELALYCSLFRVSIIMIFQWIRVLLLLRASWTFVAEHFDLEFRCVNFSIGMLLHKSLNKNYITRSAQLEFGCSRVWVGILWTGGVDIYMNYIVNNKILIKDLIKFKFQIPL